MPANKKQKIKGSVRGIYTDTVFIIFAAAAVIAVPLRMFQLMRIVDPLTGFFTDKTSITVPMLYAVLAASCIVMPAFSYVCGTMPKAKAPASPDTGIGAASLIMAAAMIGDIVTQVISLASAYNESYGTVVRFIQETKSVPVVFQMLFALLSCVFFVMYALSYLRGTQDYLKVSPISAAPVAWLMCRMIHRFVRAISFINVSEVLLELFMIVFLMLFFLSFARINTNVEARGRSWSIMGMGFPAALLCLVCFIPRVAVRLTGGATVNGSPIEVADLACAVFIIVYIVTALGKKNNPYAVRKKPDVQPQGIYPMHPSGAPFNAPAGDSAAPKPEDARPAAPAAPGAPYASREELEEMQKRQRDEEAFRIAAEFSDGRLSTQDAWAEAIKRYTED